MFTEIVAAAGSVKALGEVIKSSVDLRNSNALNAAVAEVNAKLMEAQSAALTSQEKQSSMAAKIAALEHQLAEIENWESEAKRYQLTEIGPSVFAYVLKPEMSDGEPPHQLCANCFNKKEKTILQLRSKTESGTWYTCHRGCPETIIRYRRR